MRLELDTLKKELRRANIRGLLVIRRIKSRDIASTLGVTEGLICHVISGRRKSRRVQEEISKVLGIPYETLWGDE